MCALSFFIALPLIAASMITFAMFFPPERLPAHDLFVDLGSCRGSDMMSSITRYLEGAHICRR